MARSQPAAQSRTARKAKNPAKSTGNNRVASSARTSSTGSGSYSKNAMSGKKPTTRMSAGSRQTSAAGKKSSTNNMPSDKNPQNKMNAIKPETPPMVRKEISAILLLAFGILLFMSLYMAESAGWFGDALRVVTGGLFGVTAWGLPFLVFAQGLYRLLSRSGHPLWNRFFNVLLLFMLISAMFQAGVHPRSEYLNSSLNLLIPQFFKEGAQTLDASQSSHVLGGGVFGGILGVPLLFVFQKAGAMVVLATLGLIIALIVTRMSIMDAARSVARGTAYTFNHVVEANRRRKEARQELYQAQTLEARNTGNDKKPNHNTLKAKETEQIKRQKGAKFLDVETFDPLSGDDSEEESGPTFHYPSAFVHYNHDVGDLRAGLDEDEEIAFDIEDSNENENGLTHSPGKSTSHSLEFHNAGNMNKIDHETLKNKTHNGIIMNDTLTKKESQTNSSSQDFNIDYMANYELRQAKALNNNEKNAIKMPGNLLYNSVPEEVPEGKGLPHKKLGDEWEERLAKEAAERLTGKSFTDIPDGFQNINLLEGRPYTFPPVMLLQESREDNENKRRIRQTAEENARKLEATLESFGIGAKVIHISVGPAITRYELQPAPGIKVSRIVNLTDDIALNLASSGVRIEAPIPGKAAIGVEVPNKEVSPISLRSVLESKQFENNSSKLSVALGKDISGENMIIDLAKMPHLLIAGATGSGKSVCINSIIISLLFKASPDEVKLLMIDPKVVELGVYNGIPHLLIPVVTDANKAAGALRWAVQEMVLRYKIFAERGVRDLAGYNASIDESGEGIRLPQMVIIIDELADLMMVAPRDVEDSICRLAQMARAAGMHLVIATQRPSVNVITGVIKANVPSRVAFSVSSQVDSRTIIDMAGAEKLLGKGDMLYYPVGIPKPLRVKGCFISDKEVERIVEHVKGQMRVKYDEEIIDNINENLPIEESDLQDDSDDLLDDAVEALIDSGQASVSFIQRRFKVGYARAGRIIDQMAERAIVSGYEGSKPRRVLITRDMWNEMRMQNDIRQSDSVKNGKVNTQIPMMMKKTAEWDHIENESPDKSVSPAESAFLRRAMADAASQKKTDPEDEN